MNSKKLPYTDYSTFQTRPLSSREVESSRDSTMTLPLGKMKKVAAENISDIFPTEWHPKPDVQEKHFNDLTEIMTEMFLWCGLLKKQILLKWTTTRTF